MGKRMNPRKLTVENLINILSKVDPSLPVYVSMGEYGACLRKGMIGVKEYDGVPGLYIDDYMDAIRIDDTTYDENGRVVDLSDTI